MGRKFQMTDKQQSIPKGQVNWVAYATKSLPKANYLDFECRYPSLQENSKIKSYIKFTLLSQRNSLETQRDQGIYVLQLVDFCKKLESELIGTISQKPDANDLILGSDAIPHANDFDKGIEAIVWSTENAGLAGLGDLNGLPWSLSMEKLFESYIESVFQKLTQQFGGSIKSGRKHETLIPIQWDPPFIGSQNSLIPDIIIERDGEEIIIDAKYKNHWEELTVNRWYNLSDEIKKHHRNDILQLLAYSSVSGKSKISCCLIYPCKRATYEKLKKTGRLFNSAQISHDHRKISFHLTAIPFNITDDELDYLSPLFKDSDTI